MYPPYSSFDRVDHEHWDRKGVDHILDCLREHIRGDGGEPTAGVGLAGQEGVPSCSFIAN